MMGRALDLRSVWLGSSPIARFATKREAVTFAASFGWTAGNCQQAANRFWMFWIVGQCLDVETYRFLCKDGSTLNMAYPGYW